MGHPPHEDADQTALFDCLADAVLVADGAGTVVRANAAAEALAGVARSQLMGQPLSGLLIVAVPDSAAGVRSVATSAVLRRRPGDEVTVQAYAIPATGGGALWVLREETGPAGAGSPVPFGNGRSEFVAERIPAILWITDLDLRFTSILGSGLTALGTAPGVLAGVPMVDYFGGEGSGRIPLTMHRRALAGEKVQYRFEWLSRVFAVCLEPLIQEGETIGTAGVALDVTEQTRAERRLREAEQHYRRLVTTSPSGIYVTDEHLRCTEVNPALEAILGAPASDLIGRRLHEVLHSDDVHAVDALLRRRASGERGVLEIVVRVVRPSGEVRVVHVASSQIVVEDRVAGTHGVVADVTERHHQERQLRVLTRALESTVEGIARLDSAGVLRSANPAFSRIMRIEPEALPGIAWVDSVIEEDRSAARGLLAAAVAGGRAEGAVRALRGDGSTFHQHVVLAAVHESGEEDGVYCFIRDISGRVRAEEEVRLQANLLNTVNQAVIGTDLNGEIFFWNSYAETLCGWRAEEVLGWSAIRLLADDASHAVWSNLHAHAGRPPRWTGELTLRRSDGAAFVGLVTTAPILDARGEAIGAVTTASDLTERKKLEEQLHRSQRLETVGRMAGGLAHDFNNILSVILGSAELALADLAADGPLRADLEEIHRAAGRAADLTRQLLVFSRKQVLARVQQDLNERVREMERLLRRLIGEDVELVIDLEPALWGVHADPAQVEQIVINLAANVRDAMPMGGRLTIQTRNVELDESSGLALSTPLPPGEYVSLSVHDTGEGFTPDVYPQLFEPFFTTKPDGTGLGLPTVFEIAQQSGGTVAAESPPGEGATFRIYLPRHEVP